MDTFVSELRAGWLSSDEFARALVRLSAAMLVGAIAGINRERVGKAAGLRTHMMVSLGAALFALTADLGGMAMGDMSRVIQGIAAGIGFIGGGAILKSAQNREIHGLTTAANIWMTAAAGIAAGLGHLALALIASVLAWMILGVLSRAEKLIDKDDLNRA
jgi:putative Mg2+ transporter-C (MgtC) family protein